MTVLDEATALMVRLIAERDEARAETARLASQLESITAENHSRAQRESQSLEDWTALRAEVESLKAQLDLAHKFHDVAVKERDYYKTRLAHAEDRIASMQESMMMSCEEPPVFAMKAVEERDEAQAEVKRLRDVLIDLRSDMRELAERDHPIARVVYERMCEELGSDTHRDPGPTEEPKREYIVHATVEKRVRLELLADDDQEALDDAAHAALYDDTLDVLDEQVTDTSIVWRGRDEGGEDDRT